MQQVLLLSFLIRFDNQLSSCLSEFDRATFAHHKIIELNLLAVNERYCEAVGQPRAEFLHQIERQRRSVWSVGVEKTDEWIKADARECRYAIVAHQCIEERQ